MIPSGASLPARARLAVDGCSSPTPSSAPPRRAADRLLDERRAPAPSRGSAPRSSRDGRSRRSFRGRMSRKRTIAGWPSKSKASQHGVAACVRTRSFTSRPLTKKYWFRGSRNGRRASRTGGAQPRRSHRRSRRALRDASDADDLQDAIARGGCRRQVEDDPAVVLEAEGPGSQRQRVRRDHGHDRSGTRRRRCGGTCAGPGRSRRARRTRSSFRGRAPRAGRARSVSGSQVDFHRVVAAAVERRQRESRDAGDRRQCLTAAVPMFMIERRRKG